MNTKEYLELMRFPDAWQQLDLVPDEEHIRALILSLKPGQEHAPEHYRHEAFHYWLSKIPSTEVLGKLTELTLLDPDSEMSESIRAEILKQPHCDDELRAKIKEQE